MNTIVKLKQVGVFIGDLLLLYLALGVTIVLRNAVLVDHLLPFAIIFVLWLFIFYISGLYEIRFLKNNLDFAHKFLVAVLTSSALATAFFYFIPYFKIAPKTNLFLFILIFSILDYCWRRFYNSLLTHGEPISKIYLLETNTAAQELVQHIVQHPQLGYQVVTAGNAFNLLVVPTQLKKNHDVIRFIYDNLIAGIEITDLANLYEEVMQKTPLSELEKDWFLENLSRNQQLYETVKRPLEVVLAIILGIVLLPLTLLIAFIIKMTSSGPVILKQVRVGRNEKQFILYKFRSMIANAETNGPLWATSSDPRVTFIGKIIRRAHLDELPQLWNIIKGDLSFVGPRPERPEFVEQLKKVIPFYDLRHLVRPGLTGWAQINYRYGASVDDAYQKLQYDLYYLKNRSFWLDLSIVLKTIKLFFAKIN